MFVFSDFFLNGAANGPIANALGQDNGHGVRCDTGLMRPYFAPRKSDGRMIPVCSVNTGRTEIVKDRDGNNVVNAKTGEVLTRPVHEVVEVRDLVDAGVQSPVFNATSLTKDAWKRFDTRVQLALRKRLRAWSDLASANPYGGFDGMASEILEYETLTDDGEAVVDMDGLSEERGDTSHYQLEGLPLAITHSGFYLSKRRIMTAMNKGTPLQTTRAEHAARRVAEKIEQTLIGTVAGITFGTAANYGVAPKVYGYRNHPHRLTYTSLTASASATGEQMVASVNAMITTAMNANFYGPYVLYVSTAYDRLLDNDFKANSDKTTRQRIKEIDQVRDVRRLDYLTGDEMLLVQMDPEVCEAVNGMDPQTIQWESHGGMRANFKVITIQVPWIKTFVGDVTGIVHGTTS